MKIKLGPDQGNSGAIVRWGQHLDNGIWLTPWKHKVLWLKYKLMPRKGYLRFGPVTVMWGN